MLVSMSSSQRSVFGNRQWWHKYLKQTEPLGTISLHTTTSQQNYPLSLAVSSQSSETSQQPLLVPSATQVGLFEMLTEQAD
jgi:hypothetical protein